MNEISLRRLSPPQLTHEQRQRCATAIGDDLLNEARWIANWPFEFATQPVRVIDRGIASDVRSLWVSQRLEVFHRTVIAFAESDFVRERWVGRRLRKRVAGLLRDASELGLLGHWLHQFPEDSLVAEYATWVAGFARSAGLLVVLIATDDPDERLAAAQEIERIWDEVGQNASVLQVLMDYTLDEEIFGAENEDVAEQLFGEPPLVPIVDQGSARRAYPGGPDRLIALAAPQFRLTFPDGLLVDGDEAANLPILALKVGDTFVPLLANRVMSLVSELIRRAAAVNLPATGQLINDFHRQQAGRIIASAEGFSESMRRDYEDPTGLAILDAYRNLSEGVLRPYGSLLVRFRDIASGSGSWAYSAFGTLGALEDALGSSSDELVALAKLGIDRDLRNYRAHEDVVRTATGAPAVVLDDGGIAEIDLLDVRWKTWILRSYLDGVDVAVQLAITNVALFAGPPRRTDIVVTEAFIRMLASVAAGRLTDGSVTGLRITGDTATIEYEGPHSDAQLGLLVLALRRHLDPTVTKVRVVSNRGDVLFGD